jgi:hypothetical protein
MPCEGQTGRATLPGSRQKAERHAPRILGSQSGHGELGRGRKRERGSGLTCEKMGKKGEKQTRYRDMPRPCGQGSRMRVEGDGQREDSRQEVEGGGRDALRVIHRRRADMGGREQAWACQKRHARVCHRSSTCECTAPSSCSRCHGQVKEPFRH